MKVPSSEGGSSCSLRQGVYRKVESEGSQRQSFSPKDMKLIGGRVDLSDSSDADKALPTKGSTL